MLTLAEMEAATQARCREARVQVADCMVRLYTRGLTTTSGGNVSVRIDGRYVAVTAAATDKGRMTAEDVAVVGLDGVNYTPGLTPSSETGMHLEILRRHDRVRAVAHAHPPAATTFAVTGQRLDCRMMAESYALIGEPAVARYALTGTPALAHAVADSIGPTTACVLMENHGVVAVGRSVLEAFDRLEVLENVARIALQAALVGGPRLLTPAQCRELDALMGR